MLGVKWYAFVQNSQLSNHIVDGWIIFTHQWATMDELIPRFDLGTMDIYSAASHKSIAWTRQLGKIATICIKVVIIV